MCLFDHSLAYFGNWLTLKFHSTMNVLNEGFLHFYWNSRKEQIIFSFFKYFIYLFLERGEGSEKERERNINVQLSLVLSLLRTRPITQACALTGYRTGGPLVCRLALDPLSHTSQVKKKQIVNLHFCAQIKYLFKCSTNVFIISILSKLAKSPKKNKNLMNKLIKRQKNNRYHIFQTTRCPGP